MIHPEQFPPRGGGVKGPGAVLALLTLAFLVGCEENGNTVPAPRFAQVGQIQVEVSSPIGQESGFVDEGLVWRSDGGWTLVERVSYRGEPGAEVVHRSRLNPGDLTTEYVTLVRELNESPGLGLIGAVNPDVLPQCEGNRSRVTVTLTDDIRGESMTWVRCATGSLFTMTPGSAGPDVQAARVVTAAQLTLFFTIGEGASSSFAGTVPFANLGRGEGSPALPEEPRAFVSADGTEPGGWRAFWDAHSQGLVAPPPIDWNEEMVILAAVGERPEAGDSVHVRRIVPENGGTRVEIVQRVPGDFCSPGARRQYPFHIVVAPLTPLPIHFDEPRQERVPCGF